MRWMVFLGLGQKKMQDELRASYSGRKREEKGNGITAFKEKVNSILYTNIYWVSTVCYKLIVVRKTDEKDITSIPYLLKVMLKEM